MVTLNVGAGQSVLKSYVRTPVRGLSELIWNAFDADAKNVQVLRSENALEGLEEILVVDDGEGMNFERATRAFGRVGDSWKRPGMQTASKRPLHGSQGRGRYSAFALGAEVRWVSISEAVEGGLAGVSVRGRSDALDTFEVDKHIRVDEPSGTVVTLGQIHPAAVKVLDRRAELKNNLLSEFALHLERHKDFSLSVFGEELSGSDAIVERNDIVLELPAGIAGSAVLTVIEWDLENVRRTIYLCDDSERVVDEVQAKVQAPGLEFTAYLKWKGFEDMGPLSLQDDGETEVGKVIDAGRDALRTYVADALRRHEAKKIKAWQDEGVYPFKKAPSTPLEAAERDAFNQVAMAASRTVDEAKSSRTKALALALLKTTLENDPEALLPVLQEVARLPKARLDELSDLINRSSLTQLIQLGRAIGNRLDFLEGLSEILFERQIKRRLLERRQLHRILAHETWIFGEEWSITGDDERLTKVLGKFLTKLGKDESEVELATSKPILRSDGKDAIPDLVLGRPALPLIT
jgi:hypothetical protein